MTAWMDVESIMLSEISQSKKDKYHMILLMWKLSIVNKTETDSYIYRTD